MNTKEHILRETFSLMNRLGVQAMTMDMVAAACGMSKRTLYEQFGSKRSLVGQALRMVDEECGRDLKRIFAESANCFEAMLKTYLLIHNHIERTSTVLVHDVRRMFPELDGERGSKRLEMAAGLARVLHKAQAEGLVLDGIRAETAAFVFISSMQALHDVVHGSDVSVPKIDVFDMAFVTLMRGMATIKGVEYIDAFLSNNKLNNE